MGSAVRETTTPRRARRPGAWAIPGTVAPQQATDALGRPVRQGGALLPAGRSVGIPGSGKGDQAAWPDPGRERLRLVGQPRLPGDGSLVSFAIFFMSFPTSLTMTPPGFLEAQQRPAERHGRTSVVQGKKGRVPGPGLPPRRGAAFPTNKNGSGSGIGRAWANFSAAGLPRGSSRTHSHDRAPSPLLGCPAEARNSPQTRHPQPPGG
jgi:hypothetical protein